MYHVFHQSRAKVEWAKKHIRDLHALIYDATAQPHFYSLSVREDNLHVAIQKGAFAEQVALFIGDALHNLRSSLDILFCEVVNLCGGKDDRWTHFPICDTREKVCVRLNKTLKERQITVGVRDFVSDTIKPYKAGNFSLWALHQLNMMDKHQLLIPTIDAVCFLNVSLRNEKDEIIRHPIIFADESCDIPLARQNGRQFKLENQGTVQVVVAFNLGTPYAGERVLVSLKAITEEVSRTIEAFEPLFAGAHSASLAGTPCRETR